MLVGANCVRMSDAHWRVASALMLVTTIAEELTGDQARFVVAFDQNSSSARRGKLAALHVHDAEIGCTVEGHRLPFTL